jgi:ribosomal protein L11 methyltransferase
VTPARLIVDLANTEVDTISGLLWAMGTTGVEEQITQHGTRLLAGFEDERAAAAARGAVGQGVVEPVLSDEWLDTWRLHASVTRAGKRFVIRPAWLDYEMDANEIVLHVDPGRAFGSGSHLSTRLVLAALERLLEGDERMLDVGCGSGVLGIGAARIGATDVDAVDTDQNARVATIDNIGRNGVGEIVNVVGDSLDDARGPYDVITANILAPTLVELAPQISRLVTKGGRVVLAGLIDSQVSAVLAAFEGFRIVERTAEDNWVCLVLGR